MCQKRGNPKYQLLQEAILLCKNFQLKMPGLKVGGEQKIWWSPDLMVLGDTLGRGYHNDFCKNLVGGGPPTHLKNMSSSNWITSPNVWGENKHIIELPPPSYASIFWNFNSSPENCTEFSDIFQVAFLSLNRLPCFEPVRGKNGCF